MGQFSLLARVHDDTIFIGEVESFSLPSKNENSVVMHSCYWLTIALLVRFGFLYTTVEIVTADCTHHPSKYNIMVITSVPLTMDVATHKCHAHPWMNKRASNHNHLQGFAF